MSDGPSEHLPDQPDFVSAADSADPLRDPIHPDPGDPDPFDAAAFVPDEPDPLADPLTADHSWDDPTWGDDVDVEPPSVLDLHGSEDGGSEDGGSESDVPDADDAADADGDPGDGEHASTIDPDDGWPDGEGDLDHRVDPDLVPDPDDVAADAPHAVEATTQLVLDALVTGAEQGVTSSGAPVIGWDGVAVGVEPAVSAWAVPVIDPDPDFIDLDLLG